MDVKRIYVEAKKSRNFQTYTVGYDIDIKEGDNEEEIRAAYQAKARNAAIEQLNKDTAAAKRWVAKND